MRSGYYHYSGSRWSVAGLVRDRSTYTMCCMDSEDKCYFNASSIIIRAVTAVYKMHHLIQGRIPIYVLRYATQWILWHMNPFKIIIYQYALYTFKWSSLDVCLDIDVAVRSLTFQTARLLH